MRVTSLGSGSKGNATLIEFGTTRILVDSGFSAKILEQRMLTRGVSPDSIDAVFVTHEHSDHFKGVPVFANRHSIPVWMSHGTSMHPGCEKIRDLRIFNSHHPSFEIEDIRVLPVAVPHDSREACQFVFEASNRRVGILTDLGHVTPYVAQQFSDCHLLLLEFNHDSHMLQTGRYPAKLKARVGGSLGHLSNQQALDFLAYSRQENLQHLIAMHLSEENNHPDLVTATIAEAGLGQQVETQLACQENGFDWITLG